MTLVPRQRIVLLSERQQAWKAASKTLLLTLLLLTDAVSAVAGRSGAPQRCATSDGIAAAVNATHAWTLQGRYRQQQHPDASYYVKSLTLSSLASLHECNTDYVGDTTAADVVVVVMGSAVERERLVRMRKSWGARAARVGARIIVVSDTADPNVDSVVLPGATDPSYAGAQNRSLMGLQHAVREAPSARWYWLVDDDTWFNVEEAVALVRYVQWRVPVVVGHIYRGVLRFKVFAGTWPSGGGGMLVSAAAARALSAALFSSVCPYQGLNDVLIGRCAHELLIPLVHHTAFQPEMEVSRDSQVESVLC